MTPDEYCQDKTARSGSSFYYSFVFLPEAQRRAITALYAFCREVDDVVDDCHEHSVATLKLNWWREEIALAFDGSPRHPVTRALQQPLQDYNLPREYFLEVLDGMQMDLDDTQYETFSELALYCHRVAGVVGLLAAEIFGYEDRATQRYATALGIACQLTNILRDLREDAQRGRIYLPRDEMRAAGVDPAEFSSPVMHENLRELLAAQANRARDYYARALAELPEIDRYRQRSGLIMARIYCALLDEIERDGFRVLEHRVTLTPLRKFWIAWTTARRERRRHRHLRRRKQA